MVMDYATEKKLRPLYEAIDEGQNKLALQHCAKLLKKNPDWPLVKALKALTLIRLGKDDEGLQLCEQVKKVIPTDDATLQAVTLALKELGKHEMIVELYENAANQQPKNEEFGNQWFMAMVRNNDYKGQQAAAVKLQRVFKNDKYLFWAIMSLALQGQSGNALSYTLAERMMAKATEEKRLKEVEHFRLYLLILMDQNKKKEALTLLLDNEVGQMALRDPEVQQIKSELLREDKRWTEVLEESEKVLEKENSDDWFSWLAYFEAVEALIEKESGVVEKARKLIAATQKVVLDSNVLKRGPFLAELELLHRLRKIESKVDEQSFVDSIASYFARFGSKSCIFEDLQNYISFLREDESMANSLLKSLKDSIKSSSDKPTQIKNVYKNINIRKIEHFLDLHPKTDVKKALDVVNELWQQYQDALPLGEGLEKTELQYGDEFVLVASHILLDLYREHKQHSFAIQAICLLESALAKSVYNFRIKLMLVRLYILLGVYKRPLEIYRTMEIKQIQFDTMTHYFTDRFAPLGCVDEVESILFDSLQIYRSNEVETPEMLVRAYQYGTYSKIQEFIEFRRRLDTSLQHAITEIELKRLDFIRSSFQAKYAVQFFNENDMREIKYDDEHAHATSDNRDFKVFANYNGDNQPSVEEICKPVPSTNKTWVQLYSFVLNVLSVAVKDKKDLASLVSKARTFLALDDTKANTTAQEYFLACYLIDLADALVLIDTSKSTEAAEKLKSASSILQEELCNVEAFSESNITWDVFYKIHVVLEAFNYTLVLTEIINRSLGLNSKEAKRKAAEASESNPVVFNFVKLQEASKVSLQKIQTMINGGKDLFRAQLQKKLLKDVTDSERCTSYLCTKDGQNLVSGHIKLMVSSWSHSVAALSEEIDRRLQKL